MASRKWISAAIFLKEEIELVNFDFVYYGGALTSGEYAAIIIDSEQNSYAIVHEYSFERVNKSGLYEGVVDIRQSPDELLQHLKTLLDSKISGGKRKNVAFDFGTISADILNLLRKNQIQIQDNSLKQFVYSQRSVKSRYEILEIERAMAAAKKSLAKTIDSLKEGQKLTEIAKILAKYIVDEDAQPAFEIDIRLRRDLKEKEWDRLERGDLSCLTLGEGCRHNICLM